MRSYIAISMLSLLALSAATTASAANLMGTGCDATEIGQSRLDGDEVNIIACLRSTAGGTPVWKSMSPQASNTSCPAFSIIQQFKTSGSWFNYNINFAAAANGDASNGNSVTYGGVTVTNRAQCVNGVSHIYTQHTYSSGSCAALRYKTPVMYIHGDGPSQYFAEYNVYDTSCSPP